MIRFLLLRVDGFIIASHFTRESAELHQRRLNVAEGQTQIREVDLSRRNEENR